MKRSRPHGRIPITLRKRVPFVQMPAAGGWIEIVGARRHGFQVRRFKPEKLRIVQSRDTKGIDCLLVRQI